MLNNNPFSLLAEIVSPFAMQGFIIAIIKYCMASGETVSAKIEKGLMLNISTMD